MQGTLYRKYRPKKFEDVIDQQHITKTIQNSIKNGSFAHAYLLTGPRGVGKTTIARLFAYSVNDLEYNEDRTYSDIIEIDAASNRRIDEIRELREKINIAPSMLKYKVYIIDEVHMLTREAFNALLKTLEEPPEHAVFILATTDFHKVPDTIISRCVRFSFSAISAESTKKHLSFIAKKEKIDIEDEALSIIAINSDGSFRDAISLLDQFRNSAESVKADYVAKVLGLSPEQSLRQLLAAVKSGHPKNVLEKLADIRKIGSNDTVLVKQLSSYLRDCLVGKHVSDLTSQQLIRLSDSLLKVNEYADPSLALEIALVEVSVEFTPPADSIIPPPMSPDPMPKKDEGREAKMPKPEADTAIESSSDVWQSVLAQLKTDNATLYGIARMAETKHNEDTLELYFKFPFHYKQMNLEKNKLQVTGLAKAVNGQIGKIEIHLSESAGGTLSEKSAPLKDISNIFGSAEVIES